MSLLVEDKYLYVFKILELVYGEDINLENVDKQVGIEAITRIFGELPNISNKELMLGVALGSDYCTNTPNCTSCYLKKFCDRYKKEERKNYFKSLNKHNTFIDLFCGVGGMSLGFEMAGFKPCLAVDQEKNAIKTYSFNRPEMPENLILDQDIQQLFECNNTVNRIPSFKFRPTVIVGGVPCQGFSNANRQRIIDDPRNKLYQYFLKAVKFYAPEIVVMENVPGILKIKEQIIQDFRNVGYFIDGRIFDAVNFGVPQHRRRTFFIGIPTSGNELQDALRVRGIFDKVISKTCKLPKYYLKDALHGLRKIEALKIRNNPNHEDDTSGFKIDKLFAVNNEYLNLINLGKSQKYILNHKARYNNERDIEIFRRLPPGGNANHPSISDIMPYKDRSGVFKDKYFRLLPNEPSKTITSHMKFDCNMYIHPFEARGLTVREAARTQSFPDDYIITGTFQKLYEQVGNAVPPFMSKVIAEALKEYLDSAFERRD